MNSKVKSFLAFGYFLDYSPKRPDILCHAEVNRERYADVPECELLSTAGSLFLTAVENNFDCNKRHLIPLSGGLDSRAILAALLEFTPASNISTYTFGIPGSFDFDIGNYVAKVVGTSHTSYDLNSYAYSYSELEDVARRIDYQTVLFHHWPVWEVDRQFKDKVIWSGYMGDPLTGSHIPAEPTNERNDAIKYFLNKNRFSNIQFENTDEVEWTRHLQMPQLPSQQITLEEQLDFRNRQVKYVAPQVLMDGYRFATPFMHKALSSFFLSIPMVYRSNQRLYKEMLLREFPRLFSLPTKNNYGLPLVAGRFSKRIQNLRLTIRKRLGFPKPTLNYIPFQRAICERRDLRKIIIETVSELSLRKSLELPDVNRLLSDHLSGKADNANLLLGLATLELYLRAGKQME